MMILSIIATVVLLGALFYHRVSLFLSSLILLARMPHLASLACGHLAVGSSGHYPRAV